MLVLFLSLPSNTLALLQLSLFIVPKISLTNPYPHALIDTIPYCMTSPPQMLLPCPNSYVLPHTVRHFLQKPPPPPQPAMIHSGLNTLSIQQLGHSSGTELILL